MVGFDGEEFGGAQRRERHRPGPRRSHLRGTFKLNDGQPANKSDVAMRRSSSQSPDTAPPPILQGRLILPTAVAVHPVSAGAGVGLRIVQESHGHARKAVDFPTGVGLSGRDDENPGHVVGAIAMLAPGFGKTGMLERAAAVCQTQQVVKYRFWHGGTHTSAGRSARRRCASTW